jgi:hypothetical protein
MRQSQSQAAGSLPTLEYCRQAILGNQNGWIGRAYHLEGNQPTARPDGASSASRNRRSSATPTLALPPAWGRGGWGDFRSGDRLSAPACRVRDADRCGPAQAGRERRARPRDYGTTRLHDYGTTGLQPGVSGQWSVLCGLRGLCGKTETFGLRAGVARDRPACCPRSSRHPAFPLTPAVC